LGCDWSETVELALREFGGIQAGREGPGVNRATHSVQLDPNLTVDGAVAFDEYVAILGPDLVPLGTFDHGRGDLAMTNDGAVFMLADGAVVLAGHDIYEALDRLLTGNGPGIN
jgi:hypothetical protein